MCGRQILIWNFKMRILYYQSRKLESLIYSFFFPWNHSLVETSRHKENFQWRKGWMQNHNNHNCWSGLWFNPPKVQNSKKKKKKKNLIEKCAESYCLYMKLQIESFILQQQQNSIKIYILFFLKSQLNTITFSNNVILQRDRNFTCNTTNINLEVKAKTNIKTCTHE